MSRLPVVVILGATGSGKSRLAIEIAKKYGGEILSADSMQVYSDLNVITNKVTAEERRQAPHHLLDVVSPSRQFTVVDFRNMAVPLVEGLLERNVLPVVVGGTNYYIESVLWKTLVVGPRQKREHDSVGELEEIRKRWKVDVDERKHIPTSELHNQLKKVDPEMASMLHPNNRRKIIRSLQVFAQEGRTHSSILRQQREEGGTDLGGPLRFPHSCLLWLQCEQEVLDKRLDARVDTMLEQGLVKELLEFHRQYNQERMASGAQPDYTVGIFQSIGFKEFHDYLILPEAERNADRGKELFEKGVEDLKLATRRYARRQLKWIRNRFLREPNRQVPNVYGLDATDPLQWDEKVLGPATSVVESYARGEVPASPRPLPAEPREEARDSSTSRACEACGRVFLGRVQWRDHLASKKHQRALRRLARAGGET
ncbi:tRNA dimethylallyltransferase-like [Bacillus rossius redtenbacheri]|uniref:tRNA dimethylallyltransferase-like n=1 Tax=Bacillus rossius redtenbacheri TaxID=93214 RepID=UPI002FDDAE8F